MSPRATVVASVLLVSLLAGCTEPAVDSGAATADKAPNAPGDGSSTDREGPRKGGERRSDARGAAGTGSSEAGSGEAGSAPAEDAGETIREDGHDGDPLATASSVVEDPAGDMAGDPAPAYAEVVGASITGRGDTVEVVLSMGGTLPDRVGERDNLLAGVGIEYGGRMGGIALSVQGTHEGWVPFIHRDGGQRELERGFEIEGNRFVWTVPWDDLGGARRFRWGASVRWFGFESAELAQGRQAQDSAPGSEPATYPAS